MQVSDNEHYIQSKDLERKNILSESQKIDLSTFGGYITLHNFGFNPFQQVKLGETFNMKLFGVCF